MLTREVFVPIGRISGESGQEPFDSSLSAFEPFFSDDSVYFPFGEFVEVISADMLLLSIRVLGVHVISLKMLNVNYRMYLVTSW